MTQFWISIFVKLTFILLFTNMVRNQQNIFFSKIFLRQADWYYTNFYTIFVVATRIFQ